MREIKELKSPASEPASKIRVLVADDHPLFRDGLIQLLQREGDLSCCGQTDTVADTLTAVRTQKPHLLLLDLRLKDGDALELIKTLKAEAPVLPVLVLSQHDEGLYAERALRAGARGYVMKQEATEQVCQAVRTILNGELSVSRKVSILALHRLIENKPGPNGSDLDSLSDRELGVFQLIGAGRSTRQIATELRLSVKTIETHREHIKHKLGLPDAAALVRYASAWVEGKRPPSSCQSNESQDSPHRSRRHRAAAALPRARGVTEKTSASQNPPVSLYHSA